MKKYRYILFDLDGTLTDPKVGITKSVQYALSKFNIYEDNLDKLVSFIGPPLMESFQEFYKFDEDRAWKAVEFYREYFSHTGIYENGLYDGIFQLLDKLQGQERRIILATSKPTVYAKEILDYYQISPFFTEIIGSNLDGSRIQKGDVIAHILSLFKAIDKGEFLMVGDRKHDIMGARANDIDSLAVTYGYGSKEELAGESPTYLVNSVIELTQLLLKNNT